MKHNSDYKAVVPYGNLSRIQKLLLVLFRISLLILLHCLSGTLFGQKYQESKGIIVTLESDTIRGIIKYLDSEKNPTSILYKKGNKEITYTPESILFFEEKGSDVPTNIRTFFVRLGYKIYGNRHGRIWKN